MIIEKKKLSELKPAPYNPRQSSEKQEGNLKQSLEKFGVVEPIIFNKQSGYIVGGHFRVRELKKLGYKEVECVVVDLNEEDEKELNIRLNANTGDWDFGMLSSNEWDSEKLEEWGLDLPDFGADVNADSDISDKDVGIWVPDCLFKSNNIYDIPTLNPQIKPINIELPLKPYGADARTKTGVGTYHFYVDDYRFNSIWDNPNKLIESGCKCIVEPNLSLYETTPLSFGIFQIYKKRWIARFLQDYFIDVFVDLNVTEKFMEYNIMGVPEGYNAFFTRGYENRMGALEKELQIAKDISGLENPNLIIYGGSKKVKEFSVKHNLIFINNTTLDI